ncbi:hypothetical protein KFE26_07940 [Shewanella sp. M16]|uniref:hypothetical protein n=1 Tax=Shewanella sp. M16 TaxID=2830837 RepID=UPI001BAF21A2|nr:hypothetical protein [Shewanella sp. M16]MBS0042236.1 hypothetical protein [Shewanella sp. M16]
MHRCQPLGERYVYADDEAFLDINLLIEKTLLYAPTRIEALWVTAVESGWYPTQHTPVMLHKKYFHDLDLLDSLMIERLNNAYESIVTDLLDNLESRRHIVSAALKLHEEENYVASIPLFLSQVDGIFYSTFESSIFSRKDSEKSKIYRIVEQKSGAFFKVFLKQSIVKNQFSANSKSYEIDDKVRGPNRNGILHGVETHLDYGTYINSCKCLTLLSYVSWVCTYHGKQTEQTV